MSWLGRWFALLRGEACFQPELLHMSALGRTSASLRGDACCKPECCE